MDQPSFLWFSLEEIPYVIITLVIAFSVHEFAHAYVAYKFGDPTAKNQGRLTLSPLKHLDPIGTIALFLLGFGWAKPVPVNRFFFKNPRLAGVLVSIAGPLSNLLLALLGFIIWFGLVPLGVFEVISTDVGEMIDMFFNRFIFINIALFVFNLLPFPPLDGYRVIEDLAPSQIRAKLTQYEHYGIVLFLVLVITPLDQYTITPIFQTVIPFVGELLYEIVSPLLNIGE
jgi:Zn-dependent protease